MTEYDGFRVDGNTVWVEFGDADQPIEMHVFLPTGETFESFVKRNGIPVFKIGEKQQNSIAT